MSREIIKSEKWSYILGKVSPCKILSAYNSYKRSNDRYLCDVYGHYSARKESAYDTCVYMFRDFDGDDFRIVSHNSEIFTVGFYFPHPETGELCFAHITPSYNKWCYVSELESL